MCYFYETEKLDCLNNSNEILSELFETFSDISDISRRKLKRSRIPTIVSAEINSKRGRSQRSARFTIVG